MPTDAHRCNGSLKDVLLFTGQKIVALIETAQPVCVERFADYPQLGRFTLRDEGQCPMLLSSLVVTHAAVYAGKTVAIGKVHVHILPPFTVN